MKTQFANESPNFVFHIFFKKSSGDVILPIKNIFFHDGASLNIKFKLNIPTDFYFCYDNVLE